MIPRKQKICVSCGTMSMIWSKGKCRVCSARTSPIRKKSNSVSSILREQLYRDAKDKLSTGKLVCVFCGLECKPNEHDWHHLDGRTGDKLYDEELLAPAHRGCHTAWHSIPFSSFIAMPLFVGMVDRVEQSYPKYYNKLISKDYTKL